MQQKGLMLRVITAHGAKIHTDRLKLDRILSNLLSNAIKFTNVGEIRIEPQRVGDGIEIHVIDSGIGIEPKVRERLFEEFFQVQNHERDPRKGFGLGLAIARRLARQLGGDIQVDSGVGSGSRFTVVLPGVVVTDGPPGLIDAAKGRTINVSSQATGAAR
jgi:signal transduction histidine kinase